MSQHHYYQALPAKCSLLRRLRQDALFNQLSCSIRVQGPGPFFLDDIPTQDVEDTLDWMVRTFPEADSRKNMDNLLALLRQEVADTVTRYPGIEDRSAYLEQVFDELEPLLAQLLREVGCRAGKKLAHSLLYGDDWVRQPSAADTVAAVEARLFVVSPAKVATGAQLLQRATPEMMEKAADTDDFNEDYDAWRALYCEAAIREESVLVLCS